MKTAFEVAVENSSRRGLEARTTDEIFRSIIEREGDLEGLSYLVSTGKAVNILWTDNMSRFGLVFLAKFLSWTKSSRLEFTRNMFGLVTSMHEDFWFMNAVQNAPLSTAQGYTTTFDLIMDSIVDSPRGRSPNMDALRSVGWAFWKDYRRQKMIGLERLSRLMKNYNNKYPMIQLNLQDVIPAQTVEFPINQGEWDNLISQFGLPVRDKTIGVDTLLKSVGELLRFKKIDILATMSEEDGVIIREDIANQEKEGSVEA